MALLHRKTKEDRKMSKETNTNKKISAITATIIFEASALNRDEKLGGNIPSIKKLTRFGNRVHSYISRVAMRHYLFETLSRNYPDDWSPANCIESGSGENKVIQFDLRSQNILTHAELDAFGYMFTIGGQQSIIRKAPVGITKAIALETWEGDMQFNANHDLATRCGANPNPVNKEEQESFFKVSFTIDLERMGCDEWWIKDFNYDAEKKELILVLSESKVNVVLKDVEKDEEEKIYKIGEYKVKIDGLLCTVSKELMEEKTENSKKEEKKKYITFKSDYVEKGKKNTFKIYENQFEVDEEENSYIFPVGMYKYDETNKNLTLSLRITHSLKNAEKVDDYYIVKGKNNSKIGLIKIENVGSKKKAKFELEESEKNKRISQILKVLKNGLIYHSSGENDGIVPQLMIASALSLPVPLFHSFLELGRFESSILDNDYILNFNGKRLVYVYNPKNLVECDTNNLYTNWNEFLKDAGIITNETSSQS